MQTIKKCYRVDKNQIGYIKFIFEAYDGIAVVSTLKSDTPAIALTIAPGCETEVEMVLEGLKKELKAEPFAADPDALRSIY